MARLEIAVRSPIAFRKGMRDYPLPDALLDPPETVGIEFEGRVFVWHYIPQPEGARLGDEIFGPTVSVVVTDDDDALGAEDDAQRFLSALSFWTEQPAESVSSGLIGGSDPFAHAARRSPRSHYGWFLTEAPDRIVLRPESNLRLAVGYFREGLNAGSPFFRFLAFWNALDAALGVVRDGSGRDAFINSMTPHVHGLWHDRFQFPADLARALKDDSRNAVAHVLRDTQGQAVDPDRAIDRSRLAMEADVVRLVARAAIEKEYPNPVNAGRDIAQ